MAIPTPQKTQESTYVHSQTGETHGYIRFTTLSSPIFTEFYELFFFFKPGFKEFLLLSGSFWLPVG